MRCPANGDLVVDDDGGRTAADAARVRCKVRSPQAAPFGVIAAGAGARPPLVVARLALPIARRGDLATLTALVNLAAETADATGARGHDQATGATAGSPRMAMAAIGELPLSAAAGVIVRRV